MWSERRTSMAAEARGVRAETDAWRLAGQTRRHGGDAGAGVPSAGASRADDHLLPGVPGRSRVRRAFLGGLGLAMLAGAGGLLDFLWPRGVRGFGGPVAAGTLGDATAPGA